MRRLMWCAALAASGSLAAARTPEFHLVGTATANRDVAGYVSADGRTAASGRWLWRAGVGDWDYAREPGLENAGAIAKAISADGSTVLCDTASGTYRYRGPGAVDLLALRTNQDAPHGAGLSGDGRLAGFNRLDFNGFELGYTWTASEGARALPGDNRLIQGAIRGISDDGARRVGGSIFTTQAWVWTAEGGYEILPDAGSPPYPGAWANCISADGAVIGGTSRGTGQALLWRDGLVEGLGSLGFRYASVLDLSADGGVAACSVEGSRPADGRAAVWTRGSGMVLLSQYLAGAGVSLPEGWTLQACTSVSADGMVFGGRAMDALGAYCGFVATIPAGPSWAGIAGAIFLGRRRWRDRC